MQVSFNYDPYCPFLRRQEKGTTPMNRRWGSLPPLISAAMFLAAYPQLTVRGQQLPPGIVAIPADDFAVDGDSVGDAFVKGGVGLRSAGGQLARTLQLAIRSGAAPVQGSPIGGKNDAGNNTKGGVGS